MKCYKCGNEMRVDTFFHTGTGATQTFVCQNKNCPLGAEFAKKHNGEMKDEGEKGKR